MNDKKVFKKLEFVKLSSITHKNNIFFSIISDKFNFRRMYDLKLYAFTVNDASSTLFEK